MSESVTKIEKLAIYNYRFELGYELVEEHARFIEMSCALKSLNIIDKDME